MAEDLEQPWAQMAYRLWRVHLLSYRQIQVQLERSGAKVELAEIEVVIGRLCARELGKLSG